MVEPCLADERGGFGHTVFGAQVDEVVRRGRTIGRVGLDRAAHRILLVVTNEDIDVAVERRGEQQGLAVGPDLVEDLANVGEESHVGHAVGLVEHDDVDVVEDELTLADEIEQPAGAGDGHVDAATQRVELSAEADTSVERGDAPLAGREEWAELVVDLFGELTGRGEDERTWALRLRLLDSLSERDAERERLARPGRGLAADVLARQGGRQCERLDGECFGDASLGERCGNGRRHAEGGEIGIQGQTPEMGARRSGERCSGDCDGPDGTPGVAEASGCGRGSGRAAGSGYRSPWRPIDSEADGRKLPPSPANPTIADSVPQNPSRAGRRHACARTAWFAD